MGITSDAERGLWPCHERRQQSGRVAGTAETVKHLVTLVASMSAKMDSAQEMQEKELEARSHVWRQETETLAQQNEVLTRNVASLPHQVNTLTWKSFRRQNEPSSLLIGSSIIRDVSQDKLHDTNVVCKPGATIASIRK